MKGLRTLTDFDKIEAKKAANDYKKKKKDKGKDVSSAILGFIEKNGIYGKTEKEVDALIELAEKLTGGDILGEGDKFKIWCEKYGRVEPEGNLVSFINADPYAARAEIIKLIPINVKLWRAWCSYKAGRGRFCV